MDRRVVVAVSLGLLAGCRGTPEAPPESRFARAGWSHHDVVGVGVELLVPAASAPLEGRPALIVLHGCSQTPEELKARIDFESVAESFDAVVALPRVPNGGKYLGCWDYYGPTHSRQSGHAAKILELVELMTSVRSLGIDPARVWIAGLSSGGGMSMVMGCLAPDVFSGVGIAAGPTVGTTAFEISSVATDLSEARATCTALAGTSAGSFATQLASVVAGTSDYTVAQGYAPLNADVFASIYATNGPSLTTAPLSVSALHGYQPSGTGTLYFDEVGARVQRISAAGMGHAWPAGTGPGPERSFVASEGVDYAWTLAAFFSENSRRSPPSDPIEPPDEDPPSDDGGTETEPPPPGDCTSWLDLVEDDINGHLPRYAVYPAGYGVADETYVDLLDEYGVNGQFPLYLGEDGDWYADPDALPARDCP